MDPLAGAYLVATTALVLAGVVLFGFATAASRESGRRSMATLVVGFALVVVAAVGTPLFAIATGVSDPAVLLAVNTALYAASTSFLAVSLVVYEPGTREFVVSDGDLAEFQK